MKVKRLTKDQGKRFDICRFPNFHKTGSVKCMKSLYYGKDALLVRCGRLYLQRDKRTEYL